MAREAAAADKPSAKRAGLVALAVSRVVRKATMVPFSIGVGTIIKTRWIHWIEYEDSDK
ncbi:hypothetical protein [Natrialba chahannaoensis]|uniref:hypothetical protein n=1 Tax=Natrialba chahannaoensis TaxID=68911 RepID=UPI0013755A45|nr:hypothetical protein [Natrialba chahannaoensis]